MVEQQRDKERWNELLHPMVHSLNGRNSADMVRPKPGAENSIWVSHVGAGD